MAVDSAGTPPLVPAPRDNSSSKDPVTWRNARGEVGHVLEGRTLRRSEPGDDARTRCCHPVVSAVLQCAADTCFGCGQRKRMSGSLEERIIIRHHGKPNRH